MQAQGAHRRKAFENEILFQTGADVFDLLVVLAVPLVTAQYVVEQTDRIEDILLLLVFSNHFFTRFLRNIR